MPWRGAFTGSLGAQFALADGKKMIDEMVIDAKIELNNRTDSKFQTSESRNALKKSLVLPPAAHSK